eukprot:CAMPEP_0177386308 /NCGR_PEP_ID=MMETSP0368-20130122/50724_1 /TAXON_ID=447022 ORGANISM="Scrippsiella hangoei-like, Strain SHHI-4" /NCGR_SAMPLE_ID=MMETSP0368 /ASSEMBLY_ACC=CAM_ASM_000363 /LENGTH=145 /DNA_ID=CAMNT_0018851167 /DNA_START=38 /DNA_END=471 /DNA_ORIENTATION=+
MEAEQNRLARAPVVALRASASSLISSNREYSGSLMTSFVPVCTSMPVRVLLYLNSFPEDTCGALAGAGAELWERLPGSIDENCLGLGVAFAFAFGMASYAPTSSTLCCAFQSCQAWLSAIGRLVPGSCSRTSCGVTLPPLLLLLL